MKRWHVLLPLVVAFALALFFVFTQPGNVASDAKEYNDLAQSILQGSYSLDGAPSMLREPGYPAFRAILLALHIPVPGILILQAVLFAFAVLLVGDAVRRMDPKVGPVGMWAAAFSYGLAIYAARHLLELFTAFLLAVLGWLWMRAIDDPSWKWRLLTVIASAALLLTRMSFLLVPFAVIIVLLVRDIRRRDAWGMSLVRAVACLVLLASLLAPWIIRNGTAFGAWSITQRTGIILYARALKADMPWSTLGQSALSVVTGRSVLARLAPSMDPIVIQHWKEVWPALAEIRSTVPTDLAADAMLRAKAMSILTGSVPVFSRYILWTGVDAMRFLQLPSPLSPEFSVEGMFVPQAMRGPLSLFQWTMLMCAAMLQLIWWGLLAVACIHGFIRYGWRYIPGFVVLPVFILHFPTDNIVRYAAPLHPWFFAAIAVFLWTMYLQRKTRAH